jgi:hypothetical protein
MKPRQTQRESRTEKDDPNISDLHLQIHFLAFEMPLSPPACNPLLTVEKRLTSCLGPAIQYVVMNAKGIGEMEEL